MPETCRDCHYSKTETGVLICRRYPPVPALGQPSVHPYDWCGEFRPMRSVGRDLAPVVGGPRGKAEVVSRRTMSTEKLARRITEARRIMDSFE